MKIVKRHLKLMLHERCKIHDIIMQGIEMALKKRGYPSMEELKTGKRR
jgi:hypothetical protein